MADINLQINESTPVNITVEPETQPIGIQIVEAPSVEVSMVATGAKGATGQNATIEVGSTQTIDPNQPAVVTNSGTSSAAIFNFQIPKGNTGETGTPGSEVELQVTETHIQWRYTDGEWANLIAISELVGAQGAAGADGEEVSLQKSATHIQWKYTSDESWTDLVALTELVGATGATGAAGADGEEVQLRVDSGYIEWKLEGSESWTQLIALTELKGEQGDPGTNGTNGVDGEEVSLQKTDTHIQWRLGSGEWANLVALSELVGATGAQGDPGTAGADGEDAFVYIAYASADDGTDFTMTFNPTLNYIAILSTDTEIVSPAVEDFTGLWKNYKGATGATGENGADGLGVPSGGSTGEVLKKKSETDNDTEWGSIVAVSVTTKGDIQAHNSTVPDRLPVGADGQILSADSAQTTGLNWIDPPTGGGDPFQLTAAPGSDHTVSGLTCTLNANENQAFGDVCYINADGQAQLIDADTIASMSAVVMATASISANADGVYLLMGFARDDTWNWTVGGLVYGTVTGTSGNTLSQTAPTGTDDVVQIMGVATHADRILFKPSLVQTELV